MTSAMTSDMRRQAEEVLNGWDRHKSDWEDLVQHVADAMADAIAQAVKDREYLWKPRYHEVCTCFHVCSHEQGEPCVHAQHCELELRAVATQQAMEIARLRAALERIEYWDRADLASSSLAVRQRMGKEARKALRASDLRASEKTR